MRDGVLWREKTVAPLVKRKRKKKERKRGTGHLGRWIKRRCPAAHTIHLDGHFPSYFSLFFFFFSSFYLIAKTREKEREREE